MVLENDEPYGSIGLTTVSAPYAVAEAPGEQAVIAVQRQRGLYGTVEVSWQLSPASAAAQFERSSGKIVMVESQAAANIMLVPVDDNIPEFDQTFVLTLTAASGGAVLNSSLLSVRKKKQESDLLPFSFACFIFCLFVCLFAI